MFDLYGIRLVHGWCVDPQDVRCAPLLTHCSYNQALDALTHSPTPNAAASAASAAASAAKPPPPAAVPSAPALVCSEQAVVAVHSLTSMLCCGVV